jgi:PAS domain S-box-containing protein
MAQREVRLLLVDDDPSSIKAMGRMLSQYRGQRFATSGAAALRLAREEIPDLIVLDLDMPGMSGFDVCEALKADSMLARVPVILTTRHAPTSMRVAAIKNNAADLVPKPLVAAQLAAQVQAHLRAKGLAEVPQRDGNGAAGAAPIAMGTQQPRMLIVDDDITSIHILRHTLSTMGDFHFAKNGEEALELARRLNPDLIMLDAHMPGLDGFEVCASLKADPAFRQVPIVFVTRFSDPGNEMRALDLGAADFIAKPYSPAVLQARVRNLLDMKRRNDAELRAVREHWRRVGDARVADIVGAASDAIVTFDAGDEVVLINSAACRMFGIGNAQAIGLPARGLLGEDPSVGTSGEGAPVRKMITRADGRQLPTEVSVSQVGGGLDRLTTVVLRDTSDRERLEAESRSRIEAESASRTKTMMLSYIAHEMGNPLNGMLGFAQLMATDAEHPLPAGQAKRLAHILASGSHLKGLMRDVMDLGRFEAGKLAIELRPVDAEHCARDAMAAASGLAEQAGVALSCLIDAPGAQCCADTDRLHQCLVNLLTNAVKYNRPGGWARIEVKRGPQGVEIAVRDNGIGLDDAQRQHLFEPFNRLGRQLAGTPGAGLGLLITRQLVEGMKGRLQVDSEPGMGSCFAMVLPEAPDAPQDAVLESASESGAATPGDGPGPP